MPPSIECRNALTTPEAFCPRTACAGVVALYRSRDCPALAAFLTQNRELSSFQTSKKRRLRVRMSEAVSDHRISAIDASLFSRGPLRAVFRSHCIAFDHRCGGADP